MILTLGVDNFVGSLTGDGGGGGGDEELLELEDDDAPPLPVETGVGAGGGGGGAVLRLSDFPLTKVLEGGGTWVMRAASALFVGGVG